MLRGCVNVQRGYRSVPVTFATAGADDAAGQSLPLLITTPPYKWHYAAVSSPLELARHDRSEPLLVRVTATVRSGPVGIALVSATDHSRFIATECTLEASDALQQANFVVEGENACRIVIRTAGIDRAGEVRIEGVYIGDDPRLLMEREVNAFAHWYYTVDFGDGFVRRATVADEPSWTRANAVARAIFSYLVSAFIGPLDGASLLDIACSAGHYSLFFARMGARVHGFDHDATAVAQARAVAKYTGGGRPGAVAFSVSDLADFTAPAPFDIVFSSGLFYHLKDPLGGAEKFYRLSNRWLILQSCVSDRAESVFELSDPARWPFCADWEFCLVPSAAMVRAVFEKAGFRARGAWRLSDFVVEPGAEVASLRSSLEPAQSIARLGDPIYMVLEKG